MGLKNQVYGPRKPTSTLMLTFTLKLKLGNLVIEGSSSLNLVYSVRSKNYSIEASRALSGFSFAAACPINK